MTVESKKIEEGNKAIMFFDGAENAVIEILGKEYKAIKYNNSFYPEWNLPRFDEDWRLLMPVVEKISNTPFPNDYGWTEEDYIERAAFPFPRTFGMKNKEGKYMVRLNACPLFEADALIEATWLAVTDYINSENQQSKPGA
jgi:hypothetical protein